ncbi:hypothetical protein ACELLULO517_19545 [Acidisoma cellulosilytica]|uniref:Uncharacterized protein n=1 Tax=Acidisoma cellulosilyticum TaxID=2802395 RepID=A0A964E5H9_9PROT|nr:hypothetical protein [Acidisoma cellulosilyticum]MCB8882452.1 hypothetical protein [Acidisoma cellulosilyticum]
MTVGAEQALGPLIAAELDRPAPPAMAALVQEILDSRGKAVAAILFYGSCRRTGDLTGLIDLYILYDGHRAFHRRAFPALMNAALPPNVMLMAAGAGTDGLRAKVAMLSVRQFDRRVRPGSLDTTIWTRFSQPSSLLYARDDAARKRVTALLTQAAGTALAWGRWLNPAAENAGTVWEGLFRETYRAELRPERANQPSVLYETNAAWFDGLFDAGGHPAAKAPFGGWALRRFCGKPLNLLRLVKAAFTFAGGADYLLWKLQRHSGVRLELSPWQRRHPILAAPFLLWRLRRIGALS